MISDNIFLFACKSDTYDHRLKRIGHPVRSAIHKLQIGGLVVGWVTTSESPLLEVGDNDLGDDENSRDCRGLSLWATYYEA
ncbi:hypothetical protein BofuT4_P126390.1 [Botrytis cinerea T4]|uniref:Uncharacterized protein n=1 Tax=Botryotinia fuckeliana (strain T4) TaxID=999810 RepID=G2YSJ3_BOTF4|nr:hypothetical protein BofuT4_P126390.1 [Botrytis cinerea T4]